MRGARCYLKQQITLRVQHSSCIALVFKNVAKAVAGNQRLHDVTLKLQIIILFDAWRYKSSGVQICRKENEQPSCTIVTRNMFSKKISFQVGKKYFEEETK
jgi:hypothetical protein